MIDDTPLTDSVIKTCVNGLDILPSSIDLAGAEVELVYINGREKRLDEKLKELRQKDFVYGDIEERCKECQFFDESEKCTHPELLGIITQSDLKKCNEYKIFRKKK